MNIEEFLNGYINATDKEKYITKHVINKYISYEEKIVRCTKIIENTSYVGSGENRIYKKNTPMERALFTLTLLSLYTDLEFEVELGVFNKLKENKILDLIIEKIDRDEIMEWDLVLSMVKDDLYENERSLISYIDGFKVLLESLKGIDFENQK